MRDIGLDLGRQHGEAAMVDETGRAVSLGRLEVNHAALTAFARTLRPDDRIAIEASTNSFAIAELLAPHLGDVVVSNPLRTKAIASAKVKTDAIDARTLAELLAPDYLPAVWQPDPPTQALRRLVGLRTARVRQRTVLRNRVAAIVARHLEPCPTTYPFGVREWAWLADLVLHGGPTEREQSPTGPQIRRRIMEGPRYWSRTNCPHKIHQCPEPPNVDESCIGRAEASRSTSSMQGTIVFQRQIWSNVETHSRPSM